AKGLTLTPGLIDAFGGVGLPASPPRSAGGGSGAPAAPSPNPLAPQAMALDRVRAAEALKARDAGITTVLVIPKEGVLPGETALRTLAGNRTGARSGKQPPALPPHRGELAGQSPGSLMGTGASARQALVDASRYRDEWAAYDHSPAGKKRPRYDPALAAW